LHRFLLFLPVDARPSGEINCVCFLVRLLLVGGFGGLRRT